MTQLWCDGTAPDPDRPTSWVGAGKSRWRTVGAMAHISYASSDGVGTITIDRPEKKNAMTYAMLGELWDALDEGAADTAARALILTGVPGAFCAGTDLS